MRYIKAAIETRSLNVFYGSLHVLRDVNVFIPKYCITAIMGPSGCGKSTLLKSFNRMLDLVEGAKVEGKVYVEGIDIYDDEVDVYWLRRKVGMVFQKPNPLPMSIYDNVAYGPRIHGIKDKKMLDKIVEGCLRKVGLWDEVRSRLDEPATRLSGGQQQRLCIAKALAVDPDIILLDEPTASLDPKSTERIEKLLHELSRDYTIVVVTHNIGQAKRLADYVIFLYMGRVVEQGWADEILNSPRTQLLRAYIRRELGKVPSLIRV